MSNNLVARKGRDRQRYEDQLRLVAGCIPYKFQQNFEKQHCNLENRVLVLMISTPNRTDLIFPKGGWEDDETIDAAVCREAMEEAGVKGLLGKNPLGVWEFRSKNRQNNNRCSKEGGCRGYMFAMEVTEELDSWPEQDLYNRKWVSIESAMKESKHTHTHILNHFKDYSNYLEPILQLCVEEAFQFCRYDWMRDALTKFLIALKKEKIQEIGEMDEFPAIPVSDPGKAHQTLSPGSCSGVQQQLGESSTNCVVQV